MIYCYFLKPLWCIIHQAYEKGLKPKGTINPCGYRTVSNLEDELTKKRKKLAAMLGNVRASCFKILDIYILLI
jgi:hypothetical protein